MTMASQHKGRKVAADVPAKNENENNNHDNDDEKLLLYLTITREIKLQGRYFPSYD